MPLIPHIWKWITLQTEIELAAEIKSQNFQQLL